MTSLTYLYQVNRNMTFIDLRKQVDYG